MAPTLIEYNRTHSLPSSTHTKEKRSYSTIKTDTNSVSPVFESVFSTWMKWHQLHAQEDQPTRTHTLKEVARKALGLSHGVTKRSHSANQKGLTAQTNVEKEIEQAQQEQGGVDANNPYFKELDTLERTLQKHIERDLDKAVVGLQG